MNKNDPLIGSNGGQQSEKPLALTRRTRSSGRRVRPALKVVGWREWIGLPDLGVKKLKAKVDTGARSSSLHASRITKFSRDEESYVRFRVHTKHKDVHKNKLVEAKVLEYRLVKSSSGEQTLRPVILTPVTLLGDTWMVELTLANRAEMGFRMLLGREALRGRFLVDSGRSYFGGRK